MSFFVPLLFLLNDCAVVKNKETTKAPLIHTVINHISNNFNTISCLDEVADALYISKYHICHLFSKYLETTFAEYLTQIKLKNAEEKLKETTLSISQIAEACGFSTCTYFCNVFRRRFGISPLKYRKLIQQKNDK